MKEVGLRLKQARLNKKLKQVEVMKRTGINNKTLSGYENGISEPDFESLTKLAELYETTIDELISGKVEHKKEVAFDKYIRYHFNILLPDDYSEFSDIIERELTNGLDTIYKKYNIEFKGRIVIHDKDGPRLDIADQYADAVLSSDNTAFLYDVLLLLQQLAHEFFIEYDEGYHLGYKKSRPKSLEVFLSYPNLTYQGHEISETDRQRIIDMLDILFQNNE